MNFNPCLASQFLELYQLSKSHPTCSAVTAVLFLLQFILSIAIGLSTDNTSCVFVPSLSPKPKCQGWKDLDGIVGGDECMVLSL